MRILALTLLLFPVAASAQSVPSWAAPAASNLGPGVPPPPPGPPPPPPPPPPVPLDGGLSLLALAGAGYAARRLRQTSRP